MCPIVATLWCLIAWGMKNPRFLSSYLLNVGCQDTDAAMHLATKLMAVNGVAEAVVIAEEGVAYLKVDKKSLDTQALQAFAISST